MSKEEYLRAKGVAKEVRPKQKKDEKLKALYKLQNSFLYQSPKRE